MNFSYNTFSFFVQTSIRSSVRNDLKSTFDNSLAEIVDFRVHLPTSDNNLNSATTSGIYTMYNPSNSPISGWVLLLTLSMIDGSYMVQLAFGFWDNVVYLRTADGGSWRAWKQL